jgi:hypothetical protein
MKNKELYHRTVSLLLDAYNNGELLHQRCNKCVVGNICAQTEAHLIKGIDNGNWTSVFCSGWGHQTIRLHNMTPDIEELINETGYTICELAKIEKAFEQSISDTKEGYTFWVQLKNQKQGQFIGLTAVLDVLKEIHETKKEVALESQFKLKKIYNLVLC